MTERHDDRHERLALAVRDNRARVWHARLPALLALELEPKSFRRSVDVADIEALVAQRQKDFRGVSRRRWITDLRQADALVDAVGNFAVVAESGSGGLIFERVSTEPHEGDWGERATWGSFERLPQ